MTHIHILAADFAYAEAIYAIRDEVLWRGNRMSDAYLKALFSAPDHRAFVAVDSLQVVGFVEGFLTLSEDGLLRWEVDLLGVATGYQGQGIGTRLVAASTQAGSELGAKMARGLVEVSNIASEKAFTKQSYTHGDPCSLMIASGSNGKPVGLDSGFVVPVCTLNYQGIWIEGERSHDAFSAARSICAQHHWDIAGAVIPKVAHNTLQSAQTAGYTSVGVYRWWTRTL